MNSCQAQLCHAVCGPSSCPPTPFSALPGSSIHPQEGSPWLCAFQWGLSELLQQDPLLHRAVSQGCSPCTGPAVGSQDAHCRHSGTHQQWVSLCLDINQCVQGQKAQFGGWGSPLMMEEVLVGVTMPGRGCCHAWADGCSPGPFLGTTEPPPAFYQSPLYLSNLLARRNISTLQQSWAEDPVRWNGSQQHRTGDLSALSRMLCKLFCFGGICFILHMVSFKTCPWL